VKELVVHPDTIWVRSYPGRDSAKGKIDGNYYLDGATPGYFTPFHIERLQAFADRCPCCGKCPTFQFITTSAEEMAALSRFDPVDQPGGDIRILAEQMRRQLHEEFTRRIAHSPCC
jgi:hypothetical protein